MELAFPGIAKRFKRCAAWHKERHGIEPMFGLFWNFCLNGIFVDQKRVHCKPHADSKNPIGVCALMTYVTWGCRHSHYFSNLRCTNSIGSKLQSHCPLLAGHLGGRHYHPIASMGGFCIPIFPVLSFQH